MPRLSLSQQLQQALTDKERLFDECQEFRTANATAVTALEQLQKEVIVLRQQKADLDVKFADSCQQLAEAKKKLSDKESAYTYAAEARSKAEGELEQVHAILDSLEGAPSRKFSVEDSYGEITRTLSARFAVCLCTLFRLTATAKGV